MYFRKRARARQIDDPASAAFLLSLEHLLEHVLYCTIQYFRKRTRARQKDDPKKMTRPPRPPIYATTKHTPLVKLILDYSLRG